VSVVSGIVGTATWWVETDDDGRLVGIAVDGGSPDERKQAFQQVKRALKQEEFKEAIRRAGRAWREATS
jgi:hypothetical protein